MKLTIKNDNKIVSSAFFSINDLSLSLTINTTGRWVRYDVVGGDESSIEFYYHPENDDLEPDVVKLTAYTKEEREMINRIYFENHSKDQLWILFVDRKVYE